MNLTVIVIIGVGTSIIISHQNVRRAHTLDIAIPEAARRASSHRIDARMRVNASVTMKAIVPLTFNRAKVRVLRRVCGSRTLQLTSAGMVVKFARGLI